MTKLLLSDNRLRELGARSASAMLPPTEAGRHMSGKEAVPAPVQRIRARCCSSLLKVTENLFASDRSKPVYRKNQDSDRQPGVLLRSLSASQAETSTAYDSNGPVVGAARPEPHTERRVQGTATAALHHVDRFVRDGTATRFTAARLKPAFGTPRLPQNFSAARSTQKIGRSSSTRVATVSGGNATDTEPEKGPAGALRHSVVEKELSLRLPATTLSRTGCTDGAALPEDACVPHPLAKEISVLRAMYFPALTVAFMVMFGSSVVLWRSQLSCGATLVVLAALALTVFCGSRFSLTTKGCSGWLSAICHGCAAVEVTQKVFPACVNVRTASFKPLLWCAGFLRIYGCTCIPAVVRDRRNSFPRDGPDRYCAYRLLRTWCRPGSDPG
jgi:hypothetical protein